ncbi:MAG TPA: FHA domain-containing protein [Polyangiaceae bacterium]|nr:FHA domain-containing protein [Polyangiaceae bacterium]
MPYELGAFIDSTRTITVQSAVPGGEPSPAATLAAVALRPIVARDALRSRAFRETSIAMQRLRHAGLLEVKDVVDLDGRPVAIAELPMGAPLSRVLLVPKRRDRNFGLVSSTRIVLDVARAVQVLHAARPDLRPLGYLSADAVWVTTEARAILLPSVRCAPVRVGAHALPWSRYRAPEYDGGAVAGESADVYSLAVLLWDLIAAGKPTPSGGASPSTRETPARIDPDVVRLVRRSLSSDVSARPAYPGAFAAELGRIVQRLGVRELDRAKRVTSLAVEDADKTAAGFTLPPDDDSDDAPTLELPARRTHPAAGFAVVTAPVRGATEPALPEPLRRPRIPRPAPKTSPPSPKLKILESTECAASGELRLTNEPRRWVVGRAASAHLVVADPDMSREHFAVMWEGEGRYRVRDLGSKNGLFVNGKAATDSRLAPGDEVRAGGTRLRFEA